MGDDDRALRVRDRRDADRRGHRLVAVDDVELLVPENAADPRDRAGRQHDVRQRPVRRHDHRPPDRDDPVGERAVAARARVEQAGQVPGGSLPIRSCTSWPRRLSAAAWCSECSRRHPSTTTRTGRRCRSSPAARRSGDGLEVLGQGAPRRARSPRRRRRARAAPSRRRSGPKPSPGATATRCSSSRLSAVRPSGSRSHTKNVPSQTGGSGARRQSHLAGARSRRLVRRPSLRPFERSDRRSLQRLEDADPVVVVQQVDPLDDLGVADDEPDAQPAIP